MTLSHTSTHSGRVGADVSSLRHLSVVMVQSGQDRNSNYLDSFLWSGTRGSKAVRDPLLDALMGSGLVEVRHIRLEHPLELPLLNNQQMVEACLPYTPQKAFTDRIASGSVLRGREQFDATGRRHPQETGSNLAIMIPYQILGSLPRRGSLPERYALPRHPSGIVSRPRRSRSEIAVRGRRRQRAVERTDR
jgi:hypothetical protein